jgi:hypothetical protein
VAVDHGLGIERVRRKRGALGLGHADLRGRVGDLPVQVGELDPIVIDDAERADAGGRQIQRERRAETAGADQEDTGLEQLRLAGAADLGQHDVPGVAKHLLFGEHHHLVVT